MISVLTLTLCVACSASVQTADAAPDAQASRITSVVAFPEHAEITREIEVDAARGLNRVVFGELVPGLDPNTLRASAGEGARVTGTEVNTAFLDAPLTAEIAALDGRIAQLSDALALQALRKGRLDERAAFLSAVKGRLGTDIETGVARGEVSVDEWEDVLAFVQEGLAACDDERIAYALEVRRLETEREQVVAERKTYAGRQPKEKKQVTVSFHADTAGEVPIRIHYLVDTATWRPSYDVHLDRARGRLGIVGYGQVVQWTGEPWDDVELTLAMSRPNFELAVPELEPMVASLDQAAMTQLAKEVSFLGSSAREQASKWAETRFARRQERETFRRNLEELQRQSDAKLKQYGLNRKLIDGALSQLVDRFAAVRYPIQPRATIPLDSSPHKVVTFQSEVPVQLRYVATPALGDSVMLQGVVQNSTGHPLLAGNAALFVDESYVGVAAVQGAARNEGLSFGFGPDDALVVQRRLDTRDVKGPEAFRQSKVVTYHYVLRVENFNDRAVEVHVVDQIPISKTEAIQVSMLASNEPHELDEDRGVLAWTLDVDAGATREIRYSFSVECPVEHDVHWQ